MVPRVWSSSKDYIGCS